ncbi:hypothetical protein Dimus_025075 [Dionaea muscipula]
MLPALSSSPRFPTLSKPNQSNHKISNLQTSESTEDHLLSSFNSPLELKQLHSHLIKTKTPLSLLPLTRVASVCAFTPSFFYAHQIFERTGKPAIIVWNSCLREFAEGDCPFDAILLFNRMLQFNVCPDKFTLSFVLKACTALLDISHGRVVHGFIEKLGFRPDVFLENPVVHLYASCGAIEDARLLFEKMSERDVGSWNIMINQMVKMRDVDGAYGLFTQMPDRNVRSWTSMISGFVQCGKPREAIDLFIKMEEEEGLPPSEVTVVAVLAACADLGALDVGKRVHQYSNLCGYNRNVRICNTAIDMYVKCGCLEDARDVFYEMKDRTVVSWSAMISGLAMHGQAEEALGLFYEMIEHGIKPNGVTFLGLLYACSHMGLVDEGRKFFDIMTRDYTITPKIEHYGCMVDLYSRAGLLEEAHEFIKKMPMSPNGVVWRALLGGCKVHLNTELAEEAFRNLFELDPLNDGYYVVLSNIYAESRRWEDVARVRKLMRDMGVKKTLAWSSITVDGVTHEFVAGDSSHPKAEEIYQGWDKLLPEMTRLGYVPNTSVVLLDMNEDEKLQVLFRHSEKLALVYGLLNTPSTLPIRIMKNLRVCEDCHAAFKVITSICNREVIVRDRSRFHCFKDGFCSCRDYW